MIRVKFSPCGNEVLETKILYTDDDTVQVNDQDFFFEPDISCYENIATTTGGQIIDAYRIEGVLHLTIIRFFLGDISPAWDTGEYHDLTADNQA